MNIRIGFILVSKVHLISNLGITYFGIRSKLLISSRENELSSCYFCNNKVDP